MKIGNPADKPVVTPVTTARSGATESAKTGTAAATPSSAPAAEASAQVELSSTAATLLSDDGGAPAEFDAQKVARIAQAIAEGKFKVNADAIANKLIANAQELLQGSSLQ